MLDLVFFDTTGFSLQPCIPYGWVREGETFAIPSKKSKRLNILGFWGPEIDFFWRSHVGSVNSEVVIEAFDEYCAHLEKETIVVLDNAPTHTSHRFGARIEDWEAQGLRLFFLPTYSPELNWIEMLWRKIKYQWLPLSAYQSVDSLFSQVEAICDQIGQEYHLLIQEEQYT